MLFRQKWEQHYDNERRIVEVNLDIIGIDSPTIESNKFEKVRNKIAISIVSYTFRRKAPSELFHRTHKRSLDGQ